MANIKDTFNIILERFKLFPVCDLVIVIGNNVMISQTITEAEMVVGKKPYFVFRGIDSSSRIYFSDNLEFISISNREYVIVDETFKATLHFGRS